MVQRNMWDGQAFVRPIVDAKHADGASRWALSCGGTAALSGKGMDETVSHGYEGAGPSSKMKEERDIWRTAHLRTVYRSTTTRREMQVLWICTGPDKWQRASRGGPGNDRTLMQVSPWRSRCTIITRSG